MANLRRQQEQITIMRKLKTGLAKVMTLYMAFDALKGGLVKPDQKVVVSEKVWKTGGSQMFLKVGDEVPFVELLKAVAAISANDASVAIAEFLEDTEDAFVRAMNERAGTLGSRTPTSRILTGSLRLTRGLAV